MKKLILYITLSFLLFSCEKEEEKEFWNSLDNKSRLDYFFDKIMSNDTDILVFCYTRSYEDKMIDLAVLGVEDISNRKFNEIDFGASIIADYRFEYDSVRNCNIIDLKIDSNGLQRAVFTEDRYSGLYKFYSCDSSSSPPPKIGKKSLWGFAGNEELGIQEFYQEFETRPAPEIITDTSKINSKKFLLQKEDFTLKWSPYNPKDSIIIGFEQSNIWKKIPDTGEYLIKKDFFNKYHVGMYDIMFLLKFDKEIYHVDGRKIVLFNFSETSQKFYFDDINKTEDLLRAPLRPYGVIM